ncbi:hypothetical protein RT43_GL000894 [Enterococcus italicus DSM 15952]|nr:hypothetical protein RT43_GL000894 [Enterococcus italicus DSM 15952]
MLYQFSATLAAAKPLRIDSLLTQVYLMAIQAFIDYPLFWGKSQWRVA